MHSYDRLRHIDLDIDLRRHDFVSSLWATIRLVSDVVQKSPPRTVAAADYNTICIYKQGNLTQDLTIYPLTVVHECMTFPSVYKRCNRLLKIQGVWWMCAYGVRRLFVYVLINLYVYVHGHVYV